MEVDENSNKHAWNFLLKRNYPTCYGQFDSLPFQSINFLHRSVCVENLRIGEEKDLIVDIKQYRVFEDRYSKWNSPQKAHSIIVFW